MSLLHPAIFGLGLAALALPIAVHFLFRRRRRPEAWAAMRFVLEAYKRQRKRLRFEQVLLFSARCLLILLAALALARPMLGADGAGASGPVTLYLLVDNSIAGDLRGEGLQGESALDRHRARALALISGLDEGRGDRAALVPLGAPASGVVLPPSPDLGAVAGLVRDLGLTDASADVAGAFALVAQDAEASSGAGPVRVALLSDLYEGSADTRSPLASLPSGATLLSPEAPSSGVANVSVRSIEPLRSVLVSGRPGAGGSGGVTQAVVTLERAGAGANAPESVRVRLSAEVVDELGRQETGGVTGLDGGDRAASLGEQVARFAPGERSATVAFAVDLSALPGRGREVVLVAQIDRDRLPGDNVARRVVERREALRVGVVAQPRFGERPAIDRFTPGDWVRLALSPESRDASLSARGREIEPVDVPAGAVDTARLSGLDAAVVAEPEGVDATGWAALRSFADAGRAVVVFPSADPAAQRWLGAFEQAFGTGLTIDPEPRSAGGDEGGRGFPLATREGEAGVGGGEGAGLDLFALIRAELPALAGSVTTARRLEIERPRAEAGLGARVLWSFASGAPLAVAVRPGAGVGEGVEGSPGRAGPGLVVVFASPLDLGWTDLPARPLVVPLVQESVRQGISAARPSRLGVAGASLSLPRSASSVRTLTGPGAGATEPVREGEHRPRRSAGVVAALDAGGGSLGAVVINPDADGARTDARPPGEVRGWLASAVGDEERLVSLDGAMDASGRSERDPLAGSGLAAWLLLIAVVLALVEMVAARGASHASVARAGRGAGRRGFGRGEAA
ncbi:MAG: hypothetical protein EA378_10735 [Phycisphaerales bacterium]|nr:MAG: hypothetical protein EA378_10735 [Phycisphaerales bacterium]